MFSASFNFKNPFLLIQILSDTLGSKTLLFRYKYCHFKTYFSLDTGFNSFRYLVELSST